MDNITHSLIGATLAEGASSLGAMRALEPEKARAARILLHFISILSNNLPDADLFVTWLTPGTLGYLLHHRGHTHLLLAVIPLGLLALGATALLRVASKLPTLPRRIWGWCAGLAGIGVAAHVAADYMNSYGVHPFWPFWNGWLYGDAVFIIEPLLWTVLGGFIATRTASKILRALVIALVAGVAALGLRIGMLTAFSSASIALAAALVFLLHRWRVGRSAQATKGGAASGAKFAFAWAVALAACVIAVFFQGSRRAKEHVSAWIGEATGGSSVVRDVVVDPFPSHPLCWQFLSVEETSLEPRRYIVRSGRVALAPALVALEACPRRLGEGMPLSAPSLAGNPHLAPDGEWAEDLAAFRARASDCRVAAWLRFTRVPVFEDGVAQDLRYARSQRTSFATLPVGKDSAEPCPKNLPDWIPPRLDVFGASLAFP